MRVMTTPASSRRWLGLRSGPRSTRTTIAALNMATQPRSDINSTPFLERMPRESRDHVLLNSTRIRYPAGTIAFHPGDADRADILENGFARLYLTSSAGRQTTIRYVHPGELMGGLLVETNELVHEIYAAIVRCLHREAQQNPELFDLRIDSEEARTARDLRV